VQGGLLEARTLPFGPADGSDAVAVLNPLSAEDRHLRRHLLPGLVRRVEHNWANRTRDVRLFEVGTVFRGGGEGQAPDESLALAIVLTGARHPPHWSDGAPMPDMDIWDLKYQFESAVAAAWPGATVRAGADGRGWVAIGTDGAAVGSAGPLEADRPVWAGALLGFEVRVAEGAATMEQYRPLPGSPALERDVALVVPDGVLAQDVAAVLRGALGPLLERMELFDHYRGPGIAPGARSLAWHLTFRAPDRTLREKDIDDLMNAALDALRSKDVRQRES
jgi:phenylalanyl-tRNA synthetase beta chain